MAIAAAPDTAFAGGPVSTGPAPGDYHVVIQDAQNGVSGSGRPSLNFDLVVKDDPNHPAKNGKKLTKMFNSLGSAEHGDDEDKLKMMAGILKRQVYDGFSVPWPKERKPIDPRIFIGKEAWVRLATQKNPKTGEDRSQVVAVAQTLDKLPVSRGTPTSGNDTKPSRRR